MKELFQCDEYADILYETGVLFHTIHQNCQVLYINTGYNKSSKNLKLTDKSKMIMMS